MTIYDISDAEKKQQKAEEAAQEKKISKKDQLFSSLAARLFFALLLLADIFWAVYAITLWIISFSLAFVSGFKISFLRKAVSSFWLSVKRALVCGLSLFIALISPAFGIMIACTYFLMYDRVGIEEVVPQSLQEQFKEFLT